MPKRKHHNVLQNLYNRLKLNLKMNSNNTIRCLLLVVGLTVGTMWGTAQSSNDIQKYISFGVHGGVDFTGVGIRQGVSDPYLSFEGIQAYSGGVSLMYMNTKYLGIQLEVNYAQRGWQEKSSEKLYTYTRTMDYIEIPVLTHVAIGKKLLRFDFNIGPYIASHQRYQETLVLEPGGQYPVKDSTNYYHTRVDNKIDLGIIADGGVGISTAAGVFQVKVRYTYGLVDIFDPYPKGAYRYSPIYSLHFGLGYYYPFYLGKNKKQSNK